MNRLKIYVVSCLVVAVSMFLSASIFAQQEVSTKVVGFVKVPVQTGTGQTLYFYSIPFQNIGEPVTKHYLNLDSDGNGVYESASEMFSATHFAQGDFIRKFNRANGKFDRIAQFFNANPPSYPIAGWYEQTPPFFFWTPSTMYFEDGEGFLAKYVSAPDTRNELFFLGEVKDVDVEIPIIAGYNLLGNPFPANITVNNAFNTTTGSPTAGISSDPFGTGDFIRAGYNGSAWQRLIVYFDQGTGPKWFEQKPPFFFWVESDLELKPTEAFLYYARTPFTWAAPSPLEE
ncbi:MAG: hypothetical protein AB1454_02655 [Candidatus Auribacterota bacterium]